LRISPSFAAGLRRPEIPCGYFFNFQRFLLVSVSNSELPVSGLLFDCERDCNDLVAYFATFWVLRALLFTGCTNGFCESGDHLRVGRSQRYGEHFVLFSAS
jgi:hypothetical protein